MSSVNSEGIVAFHSYTFSISEPGTWYKSDIFTIKGIKDCNFGIEVMRAENTSRFQVLLRKDNGKSELAKITVLILGEEITRIVRNWKNSFVCIKDNGIERPFDVKVSCEIIWYGTTEDFISVQPSLSPFPEFHNFHSNSSLSDLKISIGGEELSTHKFILAAYSPVFLSMFETDMKEKMENRIVIEGIELEVMKIVLKILYTGYDKDLDDLKKAEDVLVVAERYDMKALRRLCEWKLFQKLDVSNVIDILDKADDNHAGALRAACINCIARNKEKMAKSEDLKTICRHKPNITYELFEALMIAE